MALRFRASNVGLAEIRAESKETGLMNALISAVQALIAESEWHALLVAGLLLVADNRGWVDLSTQQTDLIVGMLVGYAALRLSGKAGTAAVRKLNKGGADASDSPAAASPSSPQP